VHEYSIAAGVIDVALRHAAGRRVTVVNLRVGALRQVVPTTLAFAFDFAARGTACEGARLEQELVAARLLCTDCAREWRLDQPNFRCPSCDASAVIVAGRELELESIEVDDG
jgi:hydrogenase nickel incorporation protein HypA/HybF